MTDPRSSNHNSSGETLAQLLPQVLDCTLCTPHLPLGPRPLLRVASEVRLLVIGQAPGRKAHTSGVPWLDPSGDRLRSWLGVTHDEFYEAPWIGLLPMGFCYPGTGKGGDLPPRPECADAWHERLRVQMPRVETTLLIGRYAQTRYLGRATSVTQAVRDWEERFPQFLPLPHPSPRNQRWLRNNPWFEEEVLPALQELVRPFRKRP